MASWCKRAEEFDFGDWGALDFLSRPEWSTTHLLSIQDYANLFQGTNQYKSVQSGDWSESLPSWRQSLARALRRSPRAAWRTLRGLGRVRNAVDRGFLQYG